MAHNNTMLNTYQQDNDTFPKHCTSSTSGVRKCGTPLYGKSPAPPARYPRPPPPRQVSAEGRKAAGIRRPFIRGVGIWLQEADGTTSTAANVLRRATWQPEDEATFLALSKEPNLYDRIARSIDPAIFGLEDPKKAIACQLFSGTRKLLPDGSKLRGDLNVLLIGDPSTAKSQLLKYAHKVHPHAPPPPPHLRET